MRRALDAEYESVDTERDLEDAVEAAPELLFRRRVRLLARQHGIAAKDARHVVDLVFVDPDAGELVLVEVKQGKLGQEHYEQLRRYLDSAHQSRLLRPFLDEGMSLRGLLVTTEAGPFRPDDPSVSVHIVGRQQVIRVLKRLRLARASPGEA